MQQMLLSLLPARWAEAAEKESREWMLRCPCGYEQSVWDAGGVRYKATGNPRRYMSCAACGKRTWHLVYHRDALPGDLEGVSTDVAGKFVGLVLWFNLTAIGSILLIVSLCWMIPGWLFEQTASRTNGTLVQFNKARSARPIVEYKVDDKPFRVQGSVGTSLDIYHLGDEVSVLYQADNPQNAQIDTFLERRALPVTFGSIGLVLATVGGLGLLFVWRSRENRLV